MIKILIGALLGGILLFSFFYFGGPSYLESFGKKAEETGKNLKRYEQTTKDMAKKLSEKKDDITKKFGPGDKEKAE